MANVSSFAPISQTNARVLILGSMPGKNSLDEHRYYAHPRNQFWKLMEDILTSDLSDINRRAEMLKAHDIALWDVLDRCYRPGSLDADIRNPHANNFEKFYATHPHLSAVFFNGQSAARFYDRLVRPALPRPDLSYITLPSTSPAHAGKTFAAKLKEWRQIKDVLDRTDSIASAATAAHL